MEVKFFEVRDKATLIPVLCVRLKPRGTQEHWLMRRAGWSCDPSEVNVVFTPINSHPERATWDFYDWNDRTRRVAHEHIANNWEALETGAVIDVEHILGETPTPKLSERFTES